MKIEYPKNHGKIVESLMNGRFIVAREELFEDVKKEEEFYIDFFLQSFNFELVVTSDYSYLLSEETNETLSRDISIFFAILSFELDKESRNFLQEFDFEEFTFDEIDRLFNQSSYHDVVYTNNQLKDSDRRRNLLNTLNRRNIISKTGEERFVFTPAYKVFCDFAQELVSMKA